MNFDELHDFSLKIEFDLNCNYFIYFLLKQKEVVYVGQTTRGIERPLFHLSSNKVFDEIKIIYCEEKDLNDYECFFIEKYKPVYNLSNIKFGKRNKKPNVYDSISIAKFFNPDEVCEKLSITIKDLKRMMKNEEIKFIQINHTTRFSKEEIERLQKGE